MKEYKLNESEAIAYSIGFTAGRDAAAKVAWRFARGVTPRKKGHIMSYPDEIAEAIEQMDTGLAYEISTEDLYK